MKQSIFAILFTLIPLSLNAAAIENKQLVKIKNYQVNTPTMVSSGQPNKAQFEALKAQGIKRVIDLIPGDRSEERRLMNDISLTYYNIPVDWEAPTLRDFILYVNYMKQTLNGSTTLTHCKLNYRGAVFTYLYRVTQLGHAKEEAKKDMLAIWQPNETWQKFINDVTRYYQPNNN